MHELFAQVLEHKDLSRAGDLFSLPDAEIEAGLTAVLHKIKDIATALDYITNTNNQSVVEICITRVTSCIRATGSIEAHSGALVSVLESCLRHNLRPSARGDDPPHAKIASDILSCLFLNYSKKFVMQRALPVAVRFLHAGNKDLSRNVSSYLSLAAIENVELLSQHLPPVIDSIIAGNRALVRILPQVYREKKEPIHQHIAGIINQLPSCDTAEVNSILQVAALVSKDSPKLLEKQVSQLSEHLSSSATSGTVLATFVDMVRFNPAPFTSHMSTLKTTADQQPQTLGSVVIIVGAVGRMNNVEAGESMRYLVACLSMSDSHTMPLILKEIKSISDLYKSHLADHIEEILKYSQTAPISARIIIQQLKDVANTKSVNEKEPVENVPVSTSNAALVPVPERRSTSSQTEGAITVITVGNPPLPHRDPVTMTILSSPLAGTMSLPNYKHASTSTREIREMYRPNSISPCGSSITMISTTSGAFPVPPYMHSSSRQVSIRNLDTPTPVAAPAQDRPPVTVAPVGSSHSVAVGPGGSVHCISLATPEERRLSAGTMTQGASRSLTPVSAITHVPPLHAVPTSYPPGQPNAIPFRDAVQQFCEKHLDKIKAYIDNASARVPIPIKATLDEWKHKKNCRLHFICFGQSMHCLYNQNFFTIKTKIPRIWIHLMFLATQARSQRAVSQQDPSVGNLKAVWDSIKTDSGNSFVRIVTSSFPSARDQDLLLGELKNNRFFDVFEFAAVENHWACFLCNHPERASGLLQDGRPAIEGRLKEKKGRWKIFKRWKTRYFTLSGATITYSKKDSRKATLPVNQIQSVKALRKGMRDRPTAFEIFTNDQTYVFKVKDGKNAEQWVQCLQIAVARSQKQDKLSDMDKQLWDLNQKNAAEREKEAQTKL